MIDIKSVKIEKNIFKLSLYMFIYHDMYCLFRSANVWTGLYSVDASHAYWQGSCQMLDFEFWEVGQTFSYGAPCTYMDSVDLLWHFDDCSNQHYVMCQIPKG